MSWFEAGLNCAVGITLAHVRAEFGLVAPDTGWKITSLGLELGLKCFSCPTNMFEMLKNGPIQNRDKKSKSRKCSQTKHQKKMSTASIKMFHLNFDYLKCGFLYYK